MTHLILSIFRLVSRLPLRVLYFFSDLMFVLLYRLLGYRREVVGDNLRRSFPELDEAGIRHIEIGFYQHFCDLLVESLKMLTMGEAELSHRLKLVNPELVEQYHAQGKSIILLSGHYANWEWFGYLPKALPHLVTAFYQPLSNPVFDQLTKQARENHGVVAIKSTQAYRALAQYAQEGVLTFSLVLGDQSPPRDSAKHWTTFLHQPTAFLTGADRIAKKLNQVVMFPRLSKTSRGHYALEFVVIEEKPTTAEPGQIIERYARVLEANIQDDPSLWLWTHRRWKLKPG